MPREPRLREYLTRDEVALLLRAAKKSPRYGARDHAMILLAYRHGLRASEVTGLRWSDLDLATGTIYCRRTKNSRSSLHPMKPDEVKAVEKVLRNHRVLATDYVFQSERSEKMGRIAFWRIVSQAGWRAGLPVKAYAHQLRHACGYYLANKGCVCVSSRITSGTSRFRIPYGIRRSIQPDSPACGSSGQAQHRMPARPRLSSDCSERFPAGISE